MAVLEKKKAIQGANNSRKRLIKHMAAALELLVLLLAAGCSRLLSIVDPSAF